jgi:hypothetical protein
MNELTKEYQVWCAARGYPAMSADELECEIMAALDGEKTILPTSCAPSRDDVAWLSKFIDRWEAID